MIQTVLGPIDPGALGTTMTHEHLFWDQTCWWPGEPEEPSLRALAHAKVGIENLGQIYYHAHLNLDNIKQSDVDLAIAETRLYRQAGGDTLVDVTSIGVGRNPGAIRTVAEATGLNIVMGSGYYISTAQDEQIRNTDIHELADGIVHEFEAGVDDSGIKPGVIGEIGVSNLDNTSEINMLKAAAIAQNRIGAALYIHPPIFETKALEILDILEQAGADLTRVVMCHCDPTLEQPGYHDAIAKRGAYIEYDQFGIEFVGVEGLFLPRDIERIRAIIKQIQLGNLRRILVSQDVCFKICLVQFGGWGYAHILRDIVPIAKNQGLTDTEIHTLLVENPRDMLAY
jgi:phosphotriesterase-related protein